MPIIRIDPGKKAQRKEQRGQAVGAIIGKAYGGPGLVAFAAKMGGDFVQVLKNFGKEPVYPFEVDTETNRLTLLAPDYSKSVNTKTRVLAPKMQAADKAVEAILQQVWNSGEIAALLPKRYRPQVQELLSQRAILYREPEPPGPTETEGAQYPIGSNVTMPIVPPGGFAGFAQMTPASKYAQGISKLGKLAKRLTRRRKSKKKAGGKRKRKAGGKRKARLVKGSAAAKRYMAALRRKRK